MLRDLSPLAGAAGVTTGTITPDFDTYQQVNCTGLTGAVTIAAPTSVAQDARMRKLKFKDNGTARGITWNAIFRNGTAVAPTTTVVNKTTYVGVQYNALDSKWDVLAVWTET